MPIIRALPILAALLAVGPLAARAQLTNPVAAAENADLVAVYSPHVERRLMRLVVDRAAGRASLAPFGEAAGEVFAAAPRGAFVVLRGQGGARNTLQLLDAEGRPLGSPLKSSLGPIVDLAVSPRGDAVAASNGRGWIAVYALTGAGPGRRLVERHVFGAAPARSLAFAFRPEGGLATFTDDGVVALRAPDGRIERRVDLKKTGEDFVADEGSDNEAFAFRLSPRGDRFATISGGGPFYATLFDRNGRRLPFKAEEERPALLATDAVFVAGGARLAIFGLDKPWLVETATGKAAPLAGREISPRAMAPLADGRGMIGLAEDGAVALWDESGKLLFEGTLPDGLRLGRLAAAAGDTAIVATERSGFVDLYTKDGKFVRRIGTAARGAYSAALAFAADGTLAVFGEATLAVVSPAGAPRWSARFDRNGLQDFLVAAAADGSRFATAGPAMILRSWNGAGAADGTYELRAGEAKPQRLFGLAVSPKGDVIAAADDGKAVWLAFPEGRRVSRVALPEAARSVAALPDGSGFALGLADGTVARIGRDGAAIGTAVKAGQSRGIGRVFVAPDGTGFVAVEEDDGLARHLAWDGRDLSPPFRPRHFDRIVAVHFAPGAPVLVTAQRITEEGEGPRLYVEQFGDPANRRFRAFEPAKP